MTGKPTYLAFDMETGGITTDYSLLTAYFAVLDEGFNIITELELAMKPRDGRYFISAGALRVNNINLVEHDKVAITYEDAATKLYNLLNFVCGPTKTKLVPIGHNVFFDEEFVYSYLITKKNWQQFVSYRRLDTQVIAQYKKMKGELPEAVSGSLESLAKHYDVVNPAPHTGKGDTLTTVSVLQRM